MAGSSQLRERFSSFLGGSTTGEVKEDWVNMMWTANMKEAGEDDNRMTSASNLEEELEYVLSVAIISSSAVIFFLGQSDKMLFWNKTLSYFVQISRQLADASVPSVPSQAKSQAFSSSPLSTPIAWANAIWNLSLVLSLMSSIIAVTVRLSIRRYSRLLQIPNSHSERAHIRSFLCFDPHSNGMPYAIEVPKILLQVSASLSFSGLLIFLAEPEKDSIVSLALTMPLGPGYLVLTTLHDIDHPRPYRTRFSSVCRYHWHTILISVTLCLHGIPWLFHFEFLRYNSDEVTSYRQGILAQLLETIESTTGEYGKCLKFRFRGSIVQAALDAHVSVVLEIAWLFKLPVLAEKVKGLISRIPDVTIVQLMNDPDEPGRVNHHDHLLALLRGCAPGTAGLDEATRRHRLLAYLTAVLDFVKLSSVRSELSPPESAVTDVRTKFVNMALLRGLRVGTDPSIRLVSRSICALLAMCLLRKPQLEQSELAWLQDVIEKPPNTIYDALDNRPTLDSMNLDAYIHGVLSGQTDDLPMDQATSFMETLTILSSGGRTSEIVALEAEITAFIQRADEQNNCLREVVGRLRRMYDHHQAERTLIISTG